MEITKLRQVIPKVTGLPGGEVYNLTNSSLSGVWHYDSCPSRQPEVLSEPRNHVARLQPARPGGGAGRVQPAARTPQVPGHHVAKPGRILPGPRRRIAATRGS